MFGRAFRIKCATNRLKYLSKTFSAKYPEPKPVINSDPRSDLVAHLIESLSNSTKQDWTRIRKDILEHETNRGKYTDRNIDSLVITCCMNLSRYDLGENYMEYLYNEKKKPNLATLGNFMRMLYVKNVDKLSKKDEDLILRICEDVRSQYKILDSITLNNLILAVSLTKEWKKCFDMMREIKITDTPTATSYNAVIAAAFAHKDETTAFELIKEMMSKSKVPSSRALGSYLKSIKRLRKKESINQKLEQLFEYLKNNQMICEHDLAKDILEFFSGKGTECLVNLQGQCRNCQNKLEQLVLSDKEFETLKEAMFKNVIIGKDVFLKTNPAELDKFTDFAQNMGKFDVVLDGLNIAYSTANHNPQSISKLVRSVVQHFVEQKKSILLLGRVHMTKWPRNNWNYIKQNCTTFLTQNISQDDPYLLYCALNSGKGTIIVTKDLMRGHKFRLRDPHLKQLFQRWLEERQYILITVTNEGRPLFKVPPKFSTIAQKINGIWHIPYNSSVENANEHFHRTWLCLDLREAS